MHTATKPLNNGQELEATSVNLHNMGLKIKTLVSSEKLIFKETVKSIACILMVTKGFDEALKADNINKLLPIDFQHKRIRSDMALCNITGGRKALYSMLSIGGVIPKGLLGKWSPDFIAGLKRSGVIYRTSYKNSYWRTSSMKNRKVLEGLLLGEYGRLPFHFNIGPIPTVDCPYGYDIYGCAAFSLEADDQGGVGVLAGLLCGGRLLDHDGEVWICVTGARGNAEFLDSFGIPYVRGVKLKDCPPNKFGQLLVSPFWGALLSNEMPKELGDSFDIWKHRKRPRKSSSKSTGLSIGMCPLLPWVFIRGALGYKCTKDLPRGMVPFLINRDTFRDDHGFHLKEIREEGFKRFGVTRIDSRIRAAWLRSVVAKGFRREDFPRGKVPVDFDDFL